MEEVMTFSDWVRVLRNGRLVSVKKTSETNPQELAGLMVGREVLFRLEREARQRGRVILDLTRVSALDEKGHPALKEVSFQIHGGEILGIAGVAGNGQREIAEVITGLRKVTGGQITINGNDKTRCKPLEIIRSGVSHIPADRMAVGVVGTMSVASNLAMKAYRKPPVSKRGVIFPKRVLEVARRLIDAFRIATPKPQTEVKFLSGGNIQKTILAREIDACDGLLVAGYPSRGLDVGATESVRKRLLERRASGDAILLISEDLEELMGVSDRIAVLFEGKIMGILPTEIADVETLGLMMAGEPGQARKSKPANAHPI
jgi:simple sugar transport system ATP-binding protein